MISCFSISDREAAVVADAQLSLCAQRTACCPVRRRAAARVRADRTASAGASWITGALAPLPPSQALEGIPILSAQLQPTCLVIVSEHRAARPTWPELQQHGLRGSPSQPPSTADTTAGAGPGPRPWPPFQGQPRYNPAAWKQAASPTKLARRQVRTGCPRAVGLHRKERGGRAASSARWEAQGR